MGQDIHLKDNPMRTVQTFLLNRPSINTELNESTKSMEMENVDKVYIEEVSVGVTITTYYLIL